MVKWHSCKQMLLEPNVPNTISQHNKLTCLCHVLQNYVVKNVINYGN